MQPPVVEPAKRTESHFRVIGNCLWQHLSLIVIVASWIFGVLRMRAPREVTGWTLWHFFTVALLQTAGTWAVLWLLLRRDGQRLGDLGLRAAQLRKSLLPGFLFGLGVFLMCNFLMPWLTQHWFSTGETLPAKNWFGSLQAIPVWIFLGWISGGLTEETSRAFVLTRFERTFGRAGLIIAIVLSTIMFGIGHLYQGPSAAFSLGLSGAVYALIYLRRRSCWEPVIAHATFDTIAIAILFCMYLRR